MYRPLPCHRATGMSRGFGFMRMATLHSRMYCPCAALMYRPMPCRRATGMSRGFGFMRMATETAAILAVERLNQVRAVQRSTVLDRPMM